jgi:hypothetical protein
MKKVQLFVAAMMMAVGVGMVALPVSVNAANAPSALDAVCSDPANASTTVCKSKANNIQTTIGAIVNTLLFLIGVAAVIVIILGGVTYTTSAGSEEAVKRAKNMITYAVIGLVLAISAYAIVNYVIIRIDLTNTSVSAITIDRYS